MQSALLNEIFDLKMLARFRLKVLGNKQIKERYMLTWTLIFLIVALIAAVFGFTGIAGAAVGIARILFAIFLVLFLVTLIIRLVNG